MLIIYNGSRNPICVGIVGVNHASVVTSRKGDWSYRTDGAKYKRPIQEAKVATHRLQEIAKDYCEILVLPYRAANEPPHLFEWVDKIDTRQHPVASLQRISNKYQARFRSNHFVLKKSFCATRRADHRIGTALGAPA